MEFDQDQKTTALKFARALAGRDYAAAHALCSNEYREQCGAGFLGQEFERIVPLDWGEIDPIELVDLGGIPFIYIQLGGDVYSEAIMINSFVSENEQTKIASFEFGRP
jgi:hypothetical protein